jgi:diguanylate cyclase
MKLGLNKEQKSPADPQKLPEGLETCLEKNDFFIATIQTLLRFINEFALDIKELKSDVFKQKLDELEVEFKRSQKLKKTATAFRKQQKRIQRFIDRQKQYLKDREKELKDIIDLLAKAMVTLDTDNQQFNQKIYEQSEKIESITRLDDIKKLKYALIDEVENMRKTVRDKQDRDNKQLKILSRQVNTLYDELKKAKIESVTDGLTGVFNRKALDDHIGALVEQNKFTHTPFAILMVDIDDFKTINDSYGHPTGDRVLLALAQKCRGLIRDEDFIARFGGEEFVIVLSNVTPTNALKKARLISQTVADTHYDLDDIKTGHILSITVSIGISIYQRGDTLATLVDRADKALYLAKSTGKNSVVSEEELLTQKAAKGV